MIEKKTITQNVDNNIASIYFLTIFSKQLSAINNFAGYSNHTCCTRLNAYTVIVFSKRKRLITLKLCQEC